MIVYDPLYGRIKIPRYLADLASTPEVRRLSQIRLLNTVSPTVATLGELRRYAHTLGVLYLCETNPLHGFSSEERRALAASVLVHDVGTPPFGHLFEYHLREHSGWSHEKIASGVLFGTATPENNAHQIFAGRALGFRKELAKAKIDVDIVSDILHKNHPLSRLLFGTLDFDNLDNIARMAWALGLAPDLSGLQQLARLIGAESSSELVTLSQDPGMTLVAQWGELRQRVYEIVVFDPPTVAAQAVLSKAMERALKDEILSDNDWYLTDEQLIAALSEHSATKDAVAEYWGRLPELVFWMQHRGELASVCSGGRAELHRRIESVMAKHANTSHVFGYSFEDRGTFAKKLHFRDPAIGADWQFGTTSRSVVIYGFARASASVSQRAKAAIFREVLDDLRLSEHSVLRTSFDLIEDAEHAQRAFDLAP